MAKPVVPGDIVTAGVGDNVWSQLRMVHEGVIIPHASVCVHRAQAPTEMWDQMGPISIFHLGGYVSCLLTLSVIFRPRRVVC